MKMIVRTAMVAALFAALTASSAEASPTDTAAQWSLSGLYVDTYRPQSTGRVYVEFESSNGTPRSSFPGTGNQPSNICTASRKLQVHPDLPGRDEILKTLLSAGLARKPLHVWYWADTNGNCYVKNLSLTM